VAAYPDHGLGGDVLLRAADTALYRAKREGRDRIIIAGPSELPRSI
jgi:GGDEF domain-containing protein